ncbi:hypothetical protein ABTY65_022430 (plasmid) [Escherichia coli]
MPGNCPHYGRWPQHGFKQVVTASLKLRDYDGQVAEAMPMIPK